VVVNIEKEQKLREGKGIPCGLSELRKFAHGPVLHQ
jgi:hypothetical protein